MISTRSKLTLLGALYTTQFLALGFLILALPAILRERGFPLEQIGLLYIFGLVWVFKFLWAPLIDRYGSRRLGHYRGWLLALQSLLVIAVLGMIPLDLTTNFPIILAGIGVITFLSATQDIAADALAVGLLEPDERGLGNGVQAAGGLLGNLLGGGVVLVVYDYVGWEGSMMVLALGTATSLVLILRHRERPRLMADTTQRPGFGEIVHLLRRPGMGRWSLLLAAYAMCLSLGYALVNPILLDIGWSLTRIGSVILIVGSLVGIVGSLAAGAMVRALGRRRSLVLFGLSQALILASLLIPALRITAPVAVYFAVGSVLLAYGAVNSVLLTVMMDKSRVGTAGTDFTVQACIAMIGGILISGIGVALAGAFGYAAVLLSGVAFTLLVVFAVRWVEIDEPAQEAPSTLAGIEQSNVQTRSGQPTP